MRSASRILFVAMITVGGVVATAVPGGAGEAHNSVTIDKVVVGTAPAGTVFSVNLDCQSTLGSGSALIPSVTFDATGKPLSTNVFQVSAGQTCTVTETATGGATTTGYGCTIQHGSSDQIGPPFLGNCTGDNEVAFGDVIGDEATITVTNTFVAPTPPPAPPVVQAVVVAPTFTG